MRRAWCILCAGWVSTVTVFASDEDSVDSSSEVNSRRSSRGSISEKELWPEELSFPPNRYQEPHSPYEIINRIALGDFDSSDALSDDSTQEDQSVSEDAWGYSPEASEEALTDSDLACPSDRFISPIGEAQAIQDAAQLLATFSSFSVEKGTANKKLIFFMTAGTGEEHHVNRQLSQRLMLHPTMRNKRPELFKASDGVAELTDDGRSQVQFLHGLFRRFVSLVKDLPEEKKRLTCIDAFLTSALQSGIETCLEALSGLVERLACHRASISATINDGYTCSSVRIMVVPHLREVVEAEADIGESFLSVLKKTKNIRIQNGYQRDAFDCTIASYGLRWRKHQLGANEGASFDKQMALLKAATTPSRDSAEIIQVLDKYAYPKGHHCFRPVDEQSDTFAYLKEVARQEPATQRAVWITPEEMDSDFVESDASVMRRNLSLLRALCAMENTTRSLLVAHPKLVERISGESMDNGELMGFSLDCEALAKCLAKAGFRGWETTKKT